MYKNSEKTISIDFGRLIKLKSLSLVLLEWFRSKWHRTIQGEDYKQHANGVYYYLIEVTT